MRPISLILLLIVVATANGGKPHYNLDDASVLFEKFIKDNDRNYKDEVDKAIHYEAFVKSLKTINNANTDESSATFDINNFADYTSEESNNMYGFIPDSE